MPNNITAGKSWIERMAQRLLKRCSHNALLDVGAGSGTCADFLKNRLPDTEFTAVEVWEPYIDQFQLDTKYQNVIKADIRDYVPEANYGLTILGNVLAHLDKSQAVDVYEKLLKASEFVVLIIPVGARSRKAANNLCQEHNEDWSHGEVVAVFKHLALYYFEGEVGIYVGFNPELHTYEEVIAAYRPTIAVYGIYKNEEKFMERFLQSAQSAEEIVLCDTGSTDGTNKIIQQFSAANPRANIKVYPICVFPWRFDDARNTALSLVSPDIDICISLDMDEYLMEGWKEHFLEQWVFGYTRYHHKFKTIWPAGNVSEHWHERIHTRCGYTWKLPVHEMLEYSGRESVKHLPDFWMYQEPDGDKSRASYLPLLEQSVKERKDVWKSWSFLAGEYLAAGRFAEAMRAIDSALALPDCDKSFLHKQRHFVYKARNQVDLALLSLNNAILYLPQRREPYFEKALYLHQLGKNVEAYFTFKESEQRTAKIIDYHYNAAAWGCEFALWRLKLEQLAKKEGVNIE